jgi:hypothetical protein
MLKTLALAIAVNLIVPYGVNAQAKPQQPTPAQSEVDTADKLVCVDKNAPPPVKGKKVKKEKANAFGDNVVPLTLVICEVQNALDAYQQSKEVDDNTLPKISTADFDFKTVVDTKGTAGIGLFIFKILGGSIDKQKTNDVDFQYVPKSMLKTGFEARKAQTFQEELLAVITSAAKAVKEQRDMPARPGDKDPLVFKQLTVTVSYGVTVSGSIGVSIPIHIVTLTAQLDHSKNSVQSVKLVFAPPPKPGEKPQS